MSNIQPLNQAFRLVDENGFYTPEFKRYLDLFLARVGGITGGTYTKLTPAVSGAIWDLNASPIAYITITGTGNIITPINQLAGNLYPYRLQIIQGAGGSATINWAASPQFKFPGGIPVTLSTVAGALDELWMSSDGSNIFIVTGAFNIH